MMMMMMMMMMVLMCDLVIRIGNWEGLVGTISRSLHGNCHKNPFLSPMLTTLSISKCWVGLQSKLCVGVGGGGTSKLGYPGLPKGDKRALAVRGTYGGLCRDHREKRLCCRSIISTYIIGR